MNKNLKWSSNIEFLTTKTIEVPLRVDLGVMLLDTRRKVTMLRWFGKIQRMLETRLVKKIFNKVNYVWVGKGRARRKTWKKWVDVIVNDFEIREQLKLDEYIKGVLDKGKRLKFKLRSGTNALERELERWGRDEGICQCCKEGKVEDVHHFVMKCPTYARRRERLWNDLTKLVQNNELR